MVFRKGNKVEAKPKSERESGSEGILLHSLF
jgi:hypothetical protein